LFQDKNLSHLCKGIFLFRCTRLFSFLEGWRRTALIRFIFLPVGGFFLDRFNIALDGPAGAGKSTVARMVAKALGFIYVDTGAMYRAVTWAVLARGLTPGQTDQVIAAAKELRIELVAGSGGQQVYVNGTDATEYIRTGEINSHVSKIAQIPEIREFLVFQQKQMAAGKGVVMDGRDIGTKVLPDAEVKVFLTASPRQRAERRFNELKNPDITLDQLEKEIALRDEMDRERETSPLVQADDAVLLDSTDMSLDQVVQAILELCRTKINGGNV
jgi:cytidylate kinase